MPLGRRLVERRVAIAVLGIPNRAGSQQLEADAGVSGEGGAVKRGGAAGSAGGSAHDGGGSRPLSPSPPASCAPSRSHHSHGHSGLHRADAEEEATADEACVHTSVLQQRLARRNPLRQAAVQKVEEAQKRIEEVAARSAKAKVPVMRKSTSANQVLLAGAVPVVQRFAEHDALYAGLPVVRIDDWAAVTPAFLDGEWRRLQRAAAAGEVSWTKAYFPYWLAQYTAHMSEPRGAARSAMDTE